MAKPAYYGRITRVQTADSFGFLNAKGEIVPTIQEARVWRSEYHAIAAANKAKRLSGVLYATDIQAGLDNEGVPSWIHPQWLTMGTE